MRTVSTDLYRLMSTSFRQSALPVKSPSSVSAGLPKTPRTLSLFAQSTNLVYQVLRCLPSRNNARPHTAGTGHEPGHRQCSGRTRSIAGLSVGASSELSEGWAADFTTDADLDTSWVSAPSELQTEEWLALTLPADSAIEMTTFSIDEEFIDLFPENWRIDISQDGTEWQTVSTGSSDGVIANQDYAFAFPSTTATLVRWVAEDGGIRDGKVFTALSEFEVKEPRASSAEAVLSFSPPGDDGLSGGLSHLEIFWSTGELTSSGTEVTSVNGAEVNASEKAGPFIPGSLVLHRLSDLPGEERVFIGIRGRDEAGLLGPLEQSSIVTTDVAPAPVTLIEATNTAGSLVLAFSASGDDGLHGDVDHYVITFNDQALDVVANTAPQWEFPLTIATADDGTLGNL